MTIQCPPDHDLAMTVCMCVVLVVVCSWLDPVGSLGLSLAI